MFVRKLGKGITLEMYIRNTQVNKKKKIGFGGQQDVSVDEEVDHQT